MSTRQFICIGLIAASTATCLAQSHWLLQTSLDHLSPPLYLAAVNERVVWLSDFFGQVWRTTNGGTSWQHLSLVTHEEKNLLSRRAR